MTLELVLSSVGCVLLCYTLGRYNRALTLQRWHFVLERAGAAGDRVAAAEDAARLGARATGARFRRARPRGEPGARRPHRPARGPSILEDAGADRLTRLRAMGVYSRMVRAIQPLPPPGPGSFRGPGLRAAASLAGLGHRFLVGTQERFRLWLLFLGLGVRIVLRGGRRFADEASRRPHLGRPWELFARGLGDFEALDASHLSAFEALAASLAAVDRGGRLRLWDRIAGDAR